MMFNLLLHLKTSGGILLRSLILSSLVILTLALDSNAQSTRQPEQLKPLQGALQRIKNVNKMKPKQSKKPKKQNLQSPKQRQPVQKRQGKRRSRRI